MVVDDFYHGPFEFGGERYRVDKVDGQVESWYTFFGGLGGCWVDAQFHPDVESLRKMSGYNPEPEWRPSWL